MAGSKGRGRAAYTFNIEAVGFGRGEKLPDVVLQPPPLFPDIDYKPVPLKMGEDEEYMLALKQELRETVKRMPYFIEPPEEKQDDIERYSRRYMKIYKEEWVPGETVSLCILFIFALFCYVLSLYNRVLRNAAAFVLEKTSERDDAKEKMQKANPRSKAAKAADRGSSLTNSADVLKKIEELEKRGDGEKSDEENEEKEGSKEKNKDDDDDDQDAEQEEYDEEEQEEENDYINSYFEDGDDFGADSDDNMDEATY